MTPIEALALIGVFSTGFYAGRLQALREAEKATRSLLVSVRALDPEEFDRVVREQLEKKDVASP